MPKRIVEYKSVELGRYLMHATIIDLDFPMERVHECVRNFTLEPPETLPHDVLSIALQAKASGFEALDEVLPLLTLQHERQHHVALLSSTSGLLMWRCMNSLISTVLYVIRILRQSSLRTEQFLPLMPWFNSKGKRLLRGPVQFSKTAFPGNIAGGWKQMHRFLASYLIKKMSEIDILQRFMAAFNGESDLSSSAFCVLANKATQILRERYDLDDVAMEWSSAINQIDTYLPEVRFTTQQIIEADARLREFEVLRAVGATQEQMLLWESRFIHGAYEPVFTWLLSQVGDPVIARSAISVALCGPVDLASAKAANGRIILEEALPGWRLSRIVSAMRDNYWPTVRSEQSVYILKQAAEAAGIVSSLSVLEAIADASISDPQSCDRDARARGHEEWETSAPYQRFMEQQFRIYFAKLQSDAIEVISPRSPNSDKPLIEFFADTAILNAYTAGREDSRLVYLAIHDLIAGLGSLTLINSLDVGELLSYEERFNTLTSADASANPNSKIVDARLILSSMVGSTPVTLNWS